MGNHSFPETYANEKYIREKLLHNDLSNLIIFRYWYI